MNLKELRIELLKKDKTITWLSHQLGYSTTYLYRVLEMQKGTEIKRIKNILKGE